MNKKRVKKQGNGSCWVGLDWGDSEHAVSVVNDDRTVLMQFKSGARLADLRALAGVLHGLGKVAGIAVEATRNPVVQFLFEQGFTVYPINPKLSKNWRESNSVAGVKSDVRDGLVLGLELARRHESLRTLKAGDAAVAELAGLCERRHTLVDDRTRLVQRLKATLKQYYPGALDFFTDWTSPVAWRFVKKFPRPEALVRARKQTLVCFLKANRIGLKPVWLARIERRGEAAQWPRPADSLSLELLTLTTVAQLLALQPHIKQIERLIKECSARMPQASLVRSLPGAGDRLAPAILAMAAELEQEADRHEALRCLSGVAPVENQTGKRRQAKMRRRCNKHWRDVLHLFARCSTQSSGWAKAFYDLRRAAGDKHGTALRKLADKWLDILDSMLSNNECYDEERHIQSLRKKGSPVYGKLCENSCG